MPGFDFDKLKDQAEKLIMEHPDEVKKAEQMGEQQLKNLMAQHHGSDNNDEEHPEHRETGPRQ